MASELVELLDAYVDAIHRALAGPQLELGPRRDAGAVRRQLHDVVPDPVDSLVEIWSWRDGERDAGLFWGGSFQPLDRVEAEIESTQSFLIDEGVMPEASLDSEGLSATHAVPVVSAGLARVLVDCSGTAARGSVFYHSGGEGLPPFKMFDRLHEAIQAARFCVATGVWAPSSGGRFMQAPARSTGVTPSDLTHPPFGI